MMKGKSTCKILKGIRQQIADANGISYQPKECRHKGDCAGTCPACEAEIRYLESQLEARKGNGFGMKVAGIAAGICATVMPMTAAAQNVSPDITSNLSAHTSRKDSVKVVDCSDGCAAPVLIRGTVIAGDDKEPLTGAFVSIEGTTKGTATNADGLFALKLSPDASLVFSYIGCKAKKVSVRTLLHSDNNVIVLENDILSGLEGEVVVVKRSRFDDVYGHRSYKPKSHKEKHRKRR